MNLKERLQLKAAREGANWDSGPRSIDFYGGHASTHEMIDKLAGALERYRTAVFEIEGKVIGVGSVAEQALQELEKWLGGV